MSDIENAPQEAAQEAVAKESDQHEEAAIDIGSNKEDDVDATKETEPAVDGGEAGGSGKISPLVYFNSLSRVVMAAFLIAGGVYAIPDIFLDSPTEDFKFCAIFFMIGTGLFLTVALIDFKGTIGNGTVAMTNSSMYVIGAATLEAGSIAFYPGLDKSGEPLGQLLYVAGTCVVAFGLLWVSCNFLCHPIIGPMIE